MSTPERGSADDQPTLADKLVGRTDGDTRGPVTRGSDRRGGSTALRRESPGSGVGHSRHRDNQVRAVDDTASTRSSARDAATRTGVDHEETTRIGTAASEAPASERATERTPRQDFAYRAEDKNRFRRSDDESTQVLPAAGAAGAGAAGAGAGAAAASRRGDTAEHTQVMPAADLRGTRDTADDQDWESRRRARDEALGTRQRVAAGETDGTTVAQARQKRTTDRFLSSLGLFVLRLVTAAIMGLHGIWKITHLPQVEQMLAGTIIPEPRTMSFVLAIAEILIAVSLVFGALVRLSGLGLVLILVGALVFVKWTTNPFSDGYQLNGELELLLAAVGVLFLCVGGGRWGVDGGFRSRRRRRKEGLA